MGCGGSRATDQTASYAVVGDDAGETVPEKIRPLLLRRLEELKKASQLNFLRGSQTQSTKELLKHETTAQSDEEEERKSDNDLSANSVRSAKVVPVPPKEKEKEKEETLPEGRKEEVKNGNKNEKESEESKVKNGEVGEDEKEEEEEEDEEEGGGGRLSNLEESMICPGSPSFRVYCVDVSENETDTEEKDEKTNREDGTDNEHNSNEESTTKMDNKKRKKGKRFRRVLPKRSSGKNLFNAKYYTPGCMGSHARLAQEKNI